MQLHDDQRDLLADTSPHGVDRDSPYKLPAALRWAHPA